MDKHAINALILSAVTAAVVSSLIFFFGIGFTGVTPSPQNMMSGSDMTKMMSEMMGVEREERIPLKTASERKERLEPVIKNSVKEFSLTAEPIR